MSPPDTAPGRKPSGIVTALVTPLTAGCRLDCGGLDRLLGQQLDAGVHGIFVLGSVGEGPMLPDDVADEVVSRTVARVAGRIPVYAGASDNSLSRCLARLERAAARGADYGVLTLPYYGWPARPQESVRFFATVSERSPLRIIAYNLPKAVGWRMPVAVLEQLFEMPNVAGLKDTHGEMADLEAIASSPKRPAHFAYLPGNSGHAARLFRRGADGVVSTPANLFPAPYVDLWRSHQQGLVERVDRLDREIIAPSVALLDAMPNAAAAIKAALEVRGVCGRQTMPPWPTAGIIDVERIRPQLAAVDQAIQEFPKPASP